MLREASRLAECFGAGSACIRIRKSVFFVVYGTTLGSIRPLLGFKGIDDILTGHQVDIATAEIVTKILVFLLRVKADDRLAGHSRVGKNKLEKIRLTLSGVTEDEDVGVCLVIASSVEVYDDVRAKLISAEVENPIDMEHIKLALQGYNFGNGYISWAKTNYGGYSYANAVEFSTMQAARLGWDSYGDTQYPAHVLRYYPYGRAFTSGGNQAIVEVALTQLGNEGGQPYWSWYGFDGRVEWCACFVSWCADQCSYIESGIIPKFAGCVDGANWFKGNGQWKDRSYEPSAGDIIFFDWEGDGETDHVGIVEKCENGVVYTVEGNSGDACRQKQYTVGSSSIYGYGVPAY